MGRFHRVAALLLCSVALWACAPAPPAIPRSTGPVRLLVRLNVSFGGSGGFYNDHVADYLSDGTVLRATGKAMLPYRPMETNRLTEAGMGSLLTRLASDADLLGTPVQIKPRSTMYPADSTHNMPSAIGEYVNTFVLERPDGSRYVVSAPSRHRGSSFATDPDPTVERLTALADALADPANLFGSGAFVETAWRPYEPAMTAVVVGLETPRFQDIVNDGTVPHVGPATWPFEGSPHTFGTVLAGPASPVSRRCAFLPSGEATTALARLPRALGGAGDRHMTMTIWVAGSEAALLYVQAFALLPEDDARTCDDALAY